MSVEQTLREEIVRVVGELYRAGLITGTGGNVSVRLGDDEALITPSGVFKGDLRPEDLVRLGLDGEPSALGKQRPSIERFMHCAVYRARPDVRAVVHTHPPQATVLMLAGLPLLPVSTEAALLGEVPRVPYFIPGTRDLAQAVANALGDGPAVLMQNHGLLVAAESLRRAVDLTEIIERTAASVVGCYALGRRPQVIPAKVVRELRRSGARG